MACEDYIVEISENIIAMGPKNSVTFVTFTNGNIVLEGDKSYTYLKTWVYLDEILF